MAKFTVIYYSPPEAMAGMENMTEEEKMEGMKPWQEWMEKAGTSLIDSGAPFMGGVELTSGGSQAANKDVTGFSILEAENIDAAKALCDNHPHLNWTDGCSLEIYEHMNMM
jgi:hypothetical protein